ncbi:MAG TPA: AbrB/MazE/SpoVT family DNA-binding domain-containing protein [Tepidisphaeraceae bacterium]|nr:AbrB/MazE/SpoVT family DNA-binding domain-containing protein [Tepidisphaeraceae bacterium]
MNKKLVRHGNSSALVLDRAILELVKIDPNEPVEISTDGRRLIIEPARGVDQKKQFRDALGAVNRKHAKTLKRLAE